MGSFTFFLKRTMCLPFRRYCSRVDCRNVKNVIFSDFQSIWHRATRRLLYYRQKQQEHSLRLSHPTVWRHYHSWHWHVKTKSHIWTNQRKCLLGWIDIPKLAFLTLCVCVSSSHMTIFQLMLYSKTIRIPVPVKENLIDSWVALSLYCAFPSEPVVVIYRLNRFQLAVIVARRELSLAVIAIGNCHTDRIEISWVKASWECKANQGKPEKSGSYTANWPQCWHNCWRAPASTLAGKAHGTQCWQSAPSPFPYFQRISVSISMWHKNNSLLSDNCLYGVAPCYPHKRIEHIRQSNKWQQSISPHRTLKRPGLFDNWW